MIRFLALMLALLFGSYAIQKAKLEVDAIRIVEKQTQKLMKNLTLNDYSFMERTMESPVSTVDLNHDHSTRSLIVKDNAIVGEGWDQSKLFTDPSAHATVVAVRDACKTLGTVSLKGCVLYSSEEPCPMCLSVLYIAEIDKIVYSSPSKTGPTAEQILGQKIYGALIQNKSERPIPEIQFPNQKPENAIRKGIGMASY
jgi:guanine deaminase